MKTLHLFLDESGNLHRNSSDRFFVIGGVICDNPMYLHKKYKKLNRRLKILQEFAMQKELKASHMKKEDKIFLFNHIQKQVENLQFVGIVVDKQKLFRKITHVNLFYNYLIKILMLSLAQKSVINKETEDIYIHLDNRSIKTGSKNSLEDYINIEFNYHLYIQNRTHFHVEYVDSSKDYNIQLADLVCNSIWSKYNYSKSAEEVFSVINKNALYFCEFPIFSESIFTLGGIL